MTQGFEEDSGGQSYLEAMDCLETFLAIQGMVLASRSLYTQSRQNVSFFSIFG